MKVVLVVTMMGAALVAGRSIDNPAEFPDQPSGMTKAVATVGGQGKARAIVVPPPVEVSSKTLIVTGNARKGKVIEIGDDGIPIIHGVREPDDPNDTHVYRNARVFPVSDSNVTFLTPTQMFSVIPHTNSCSSSSSDHVHYFLPYPSGPTTFRIVNNKLITAEDEVKANKVEGRSVSGESAKPATDRQARVLTQGSQQQTQGGFKPSSIVAVAPSSSSSSLKQVALEDGGPKYPDFYYRRFFNNERTGVVAEASFEDDNISTSSEQVVSYSYLAAPKDSSRSSSDSRDVVYGSGSAAKPPAQSLSLVVSPSASAAKPSAQSLTLVASPSSFEPVRTSSVAATSLSNAVPIGHSSQSNFAVHHDVSHLDTSSNYGVLHQSALSTPPPHAPHTVYKANPEHFVIKDSTFQAHPGAPTFNIPIPVPTNQANHHHIRHNTESQVDLPFSSSDSQSHNPAVTSSPEV
ncbi:hypothetical protein Hamer_G020918 [Homarus americanus]|uniref:Uncharacterized protein n=1 Tax=Homarus americanus TaxID=6706 RepID=A0A8J5JAH5_HOMAM|nr:hypothetical protein Hamer_G020918 [Homarus americanus]